MTPGPAEELPVKVPPLIAAIRSNRYVHVKELYIWDVPMKHEDIATLVSKNNNNHILLPLGLQFMQLSYTDHKLQFAVQE